MAPALAPEEVIELIRYFTSCGLNSNRSVELCKNVKVAIAAQSLFRLNQLERASLSEKQALILLQLSKDGGKVGEEERNYVVKAIVDERIKSPEQVPAALKYLSIHPAPVDDSAFNKVCGVGFSATPEQIYEMVRAYFEKRRVELSSAGWAGFGKNLGLIRSSEELKWASSLEVKASAERVYFEEFGVKVVENLGAIKAAKDKAANKNAKLQSNSNQAEGLATEAPTDMFATGWLSRLHKPGENDQANPERMVEHLLATNGKVYTRFPPEPNGFLHIGHSKAISVNFGFAKHHGGHCYLRFDDTNPAAEEQIYFDKILEAVRWLGYEPYKITYSSDHFQELYDLAVELIKRGKAYTSTDTAEQIQADRGGKEYGPRKESKDRNKSIELSLEEFEDMRLGKYRPGEITLRMKQDMESSNPVMWDIIAYRIIDTPHHRTGSKWCIYPTYDFTHCLCDSFENISHSLCTTEFIGARTAYEWLCDALDVYKPRQSEYGRLNLEGTVMSKRKLLKLVKENHVSGWDDPRLYTLVALKRRGVPPGAIIAFVSGLGVSTSSSHIALARFEQTVRQYLETTTPRLMMVLNPIKVIINNLPTDYLSLIEKAIHPKNPSMGTNIVPFTSTIYIDADDFRTVASKEFFRLSPDGNVGLLNVPHPISYVSHETDSVGNVTLIVCRYEDSTTAIKPKAYIQWVAEHAPSNSPVRVDETRIFKRLFKSDDPAALEDFVKDIDPESLVKSSNALLEVGVWDLMKQSLLNSAKASEKRKQEAITSGTEAPPSVDGVESIRFQGTRVAYFAFDYDSKLAALEEGVNAKMERRSGDRLILNMIAPLKQDSGKKI